VIPTLVLALVFQPPAVKAKPHVLYVIENRVGMSGTVEARSVVQLSFDRDNELASELILTPEHSLALDFGGHEIVQDQFLVTRGGGVIDLKTAKVVNDEAHGDVLAVEDGKLVYRVTHNLRAKGVFAFDFKTHKLDKVAAGQHWDLPGEKSPDKTMSVESDPSGEIYLHQLGKAPRLLGKEFIANVKSHSSRGVPCLWLDGERILTMKTNDKVVILTTSGGGEKLTEIPDVPASLFTQPFLWRDPNGQVIYTVYAPYVHYKHYLIDLRAKTASPLTTHSLGNGFEVSAAEDMKRRRKVYHDGKAIGEWVCHPWQTCTAPGLIAFPYVEPGEDASLGCPDGIAVWSDRLKEWRTSKMWVSCVVGWSK
jgi:hypothetical protein